MRIYAKGYRRGLVEIIDHCHIVVDPVDEKLLVILSLLDW
jgi:hypothetical protein